MLDELRNVPSAVVMLLAPVYSLNLSYPPELKYTFEALQKIIIELDGNKLSAKVQALKTLLLTILKACGMDNMFFVNSCVSMGLATH